MITTKPFRTPIQKNELIPQITAFARGFCETSETLGEESGRIIQKISEILGVLPGNIKSKKIVTRRCGQQSIDAVHEIGTEREEIFNEEIEKLREEICTKIGLILYKDYIEETIRLMREHCESNTLPKKWGMGSVEKWANSSGKKWGESFCVFWRNNIEKTGDEKFIREILPHFPERWQNNYEMRKLHFCPHEWGKLYEEGNYGEIVRILTSLDRKIDPSKRRWRMRSIARWTGSDGGEWGKSFYMFWRNNIENLGDEKFIREILPHFPERWQNNYEMRKLHFCPHKWDKLYEEGEYGEIVKILMSLDRKTNPSQKKWGMGNIQRWTGPNKEGWGKSFYNFWHRNIENLGDEKFRETILPHFPKKWQKNYKMRGYRIDFKPDTEETERKANATDDIDELYRLAEEGKNRKAFDKLTEIIAERLVRDTALNIGDKEIEIIKASIHIYLEIYGGIVLYCKIRILFRNHYDNKRSVPIDQAERPMDRRKELSTPPLTDTAEAPFFGFEFLIDGLEGGSLDYDVMNIIVGQVEEGLTLEEIIETTESEDVRALAEIIHEFLSEQMDDRYYKH